MIELLFRPIDLSRDAATCVAFRRDGFRCSFGDASRFDEDGEPERYLAWLRREQSIRPECFLHLWHEDQIVGQLEMRFPPGMVVARVQFCYLVPGLRGSGVADRLHAEAVRLLREQGLCRMDLRVSSANPRAVAFYRRNGWTPEEPAEEREGLRTMTWREEGASSSA